jgi:hypothetical protein
LGPLWVVHSLTTCLGDGVFTSSTYYQHGRHLTEFI